ncbi:MAG TPA: hypothetical protein VHE34_06365 [Puia sp.]|uniref:hypothetical protein n=1 Tax=Puia sp. TaxID=2045100 RepID=UPI002B5F307F|nr:hypothetical protein [Puia sp.]HVU94828.1 hypothetical protein [Puia sp.]
MLKRAIIVVCFLSVSSLLTTKCHAAAGAGWSVRYKGELLSRVLNYENGFEYTPFSNTKKGELLFRFWRSIEYFDASNQRKLEDDDKIFDVVRQYVLGDSCNYFSKVTLVFVNRTDSSRIHKVPYSLYGVTARNAAALLPGQRFDLISELLPIPHLKIENPSQPYRNRIMGFSFPSEFQGGKFDPIAIGNYSTDLAALVYDYVLQRHNHVIFEFFVQYNSPDKYNDINAVPEYRNEYFMNSPFFKWIKEKNSFVIFKD